MFKHILVATDGSDHSRRALKKAVEMVSPYKEKAKFVLVYCIDAETSKSDILSHGDSDTADTKRKLNMIEQTDYLDKQGIKHETLFLHGDPAKAILSHSEENNYDCIVVGSRGKNQLQTLVLGSVSHKLAKYIEVPLLLIK